MSKTESCGKNDIFVPERKYKFYTSDIKMQSILKYMK
jgi:hypothetical protein